MGNLLFNRAAVVSVQTEDDILGNNAISFGTVPETRSDHVFYRQGLRISFDVEKNSESNPNTAKIRVFNASAESRARVEREGQRIMLRAGYSVYAGETPTIENLFTGNITSVKTMRNGPDIITEFEAGDSEKAIQQSTINKSYAPGTIGIQVLRDLASGLGVSLNSELLAGLPTTIFQHGFTASGPIKKIMTELCLRMGFEWSIQDGELKALPPNTPTVEQAILLTSNTGLLSVTIAAREGQSPDAEKKKTGIEARSLLYPSIRPQRILIIQSNKINGSFKVRKVSHKGDTHEGDWISTTEADDIG